MVTAFSLRGGPILCSILIARLLGQTEFGEWSIIYRTIIFLGTLSSMGLGLTGTKYLAQYRHSDRPKAGRILALIVVTCTTMALIMSVLLFSISEPLARTILGAGRLAPLIRLACPIFFLMTLSGILSGCLAGLEAFDRIACVGVFDLILSIMGTWIFTLVWGLRGTLFATDSQRLGKLHSLERLFTSRLPACRYNA